MQNFSAFLATLSANPHLKIDTLGVSPYFGKPIQIMIIADSASFSPKQTIWINARTHSAETGPSFLLEGLIHAILADDVLGRTLSKQYIFKIVPMHNQDGIILGNYRTNATKQP
ncbi:MAG: hypothetical protein H7240_02960 [Glaciimonas sp.]|nr:hypothetical protein [Glaciimonas sp.]